MKLVGKEWKENLSLEKRKFYEDLALKEKEVYMKKLKEYNEASGKGTSSMNLDCNSNQSIMSLEGADSNTGENKENM